MILGANFESERGPEIPLTVSLLIKFGGHVTMKKGTTWFLITKKGLILTFGDTARLFSEGYAAILVTLEEQKSSVEWRYVAHGRVPPPLLE